MADDYLSQGNSGRRGVGFIIVLAVHALLIWGLMNGLASKIVQVVQEPFKVEKVNEPPPPQEDTPPPPPPETDPPPYVPPPDFTFDAPAAAAPTAITTSNTPAPPRPTLGVRNDPRHPFTKPDYPPSAKRLEQQGPVGLLLYVCEDGRVREAKVEKSSGYPVLDESARREALTYRFLPAEREGQKICDWKRITITFRLEDA